MCMYYSFAISDLLSVRRLEIIHWVSFACYKPLRPLRRESSQINVKHRHRLLIGLDIIWNEMSVSGQPNIGVEVSYERAARPCISIIPSTDNIETLERKIGLA